MIEIKENDIVFENFCWKCGGKLDEGWEFCPHCKIRIEKKYCTRCRKIINSDWNFCPYCKNELKKTYNNKNLDNANEWLRKVLDVNK